MPAPFFPNPFGGNQFAGKLAPPLAPPWAPRPGGLLVGTNGSVFPTPTYDQGPIKPPPPNFGFTPGHIPAPTYDNGTLPTPTPGFGVRSIPPAVANLPGGPVGGANTINVPVPKAKAKPAKPAPKAKAKPAAAPPPNTRTPPAPPVSAPDVGSAFDTTRTPAAAPAAASRDPQLAQLTNFVQSLIQSNAKGDKQLGAVLAQLLNQREKLPDVPVYTPQQVVQMLGGVVSPKQVLEMLGGTMSDKQMLSEARQLAAQETSAASQPLLQEQTYEDRIANQQENEARGFAQTEAGMLKPIAGEVSDIYNQSANTLGALSRGYAGGMQGDAQAQADKQNALLNAVGGGGAVNSPLASNDALNALYALTGGIPGEALAQEGKTFGASAANMPQEAMNAGQETASGLAVKEDQARQAISDKLAALASTEPATAQKILAGLQSNDQKVRAAAVSFLTSQANRIGGGVASFMNNQASRVQKNAADQATIDDHGRSLAATIANNEATQQGRNTQLGIEAGTLGARVAQDNASNQIKLQGQGLTAGRLQLDEAKAKVSAQEWEANFKLSSAKDAQTALRDNRVWYKTLQDLGIRQRQLQINATKLQQSIAQGGLTGTSYHKAVGSAFTGAQNFAQGYNVPNARYKDTKAYKSVLNADGKTYTNYYKPIPFKAAIIEGVKEGIPLSIWMTALANYYPEAEQFMQSHGMKPSNLG